MRKGGTGRQEPGAELDKSPAADDVQRLVWDKGEWAPEGSASEEEERVEFSFTPLHIGVGLALIGVGLVVPVAAAGLTWWAFRRSSS